MSKAYHAVGAVGPMEREKEGESKSHWLTTYQKMMKLSSWKQQKSVEEDAVDRVEVVCTSGMYSVCLCRWPRASFDEDRGDTRVMSAALPGFQICICKIAVWQAAPETENSLP